MRGSGSNNNICISSGNYDNASNGRKTNGSDNVDNTRRKKNNSNENRADVEEEIKRGLQFR